MLRQLQRTKDEPLAPRDTRTRPLNVPTFSCAAHGTIATRTRANNDHGTQCHGQRHSHTRAAQREGICSRQDLGRTPKSRRTRPCAVHKRGRLSTACATSGRRARGEADGRERGCCGARACPGDGLRCSARLQCVRRWVESANLCHCHSLVYRVRWYSSQFVALWSNLRSAARFHQQLNTSERAEQISRLAGDASGAGAPFGS